MAEGVVFRSWYIPGAENDSGAQTVFREAFEAFSSELSKDEGKLNWIKDSRHGNIDSVLASVVEARVTYETRKGESKVRKALVEFSEKVYYYSGVMDVLVSHHPEYTALVYGAIKFLLVGVVNHQKHLTQLCTGLGDIANILPRAQLILLLYPTRHIKKIIVDIYVNILKFLLRALCWYQESKLVHLLHAITRPPELRYNDLLTTISSLSRGLTENAWASSHAEQRDMHTILMALSGWQKHHGKKLDDLLAIVSAEQAINSSARLEVSQKLSEIQFSQFLGHISVPNLPEPITVFQTLIFMSRKRQARSSNKGPPFWLDDKVQRWNSATASSLLVINGTRKSRFHLQNFCTRSIEILRDSKIPVIWGLETLASDKTTAAQVSTIDILKYLVVQAVKINEHTYENAVMALRPIEYHRAQTEEDWVRVLASTLRGISLLYIVIDMKVLSRSSEALANDFWTGAFRGLFAELSSRGMSTVVRVVLVGYGSPLPSGPLDNEHQNMVVTVGRTSRSVKSSTRLPIRKQIAPNTSLKTGSLNLGALSDNEQTHGRVSRKLSRARRAG
ncbi:hypothetical protein F5Y14DRAFT_430588 [Nemania sp. NC0429]|nr:hypothetical protein F5Y14DRAFT_430588 [Nemania sp. NC0429]